MRRLSFLGAFLSVFALLVFSTCTEIETLLPENELIEVEKANAVVPFHGTYATAPAIVGVSPDGALLADITSTGKATHLGKSTWESFGSLVYVDPENGVFSGPQTGDMTFTAANGDQLIGEFAGTANVGIPGMDEYSFWGGGTYTIDPEESNGRFAGYSGSGNYDYVVFWPENPDDPLEGILDFVGTLTKP